MNRRWSGNGPRTLCTLARDGKQYTVVECCGIYSIERKGCTLQGFFTWSAAARWAAANGFRTEAGNWTA